TGATPEMSLEERARFTHPEDLERAMAGWRESLRLGIPYAAEYRLRGKDGTYRWLHSRSAPLFDAEGSVAKWFGVCSDIDEQKKVSERLIVANQAKDEFLAVLAHELRNPLNPIRSAVHVMNQAGADDVSRERARGIIDRQVRHMARLVDELLDVSRISRGRIPSARDPRSGPPRRLHGGGPSRRDRRKRTHGPPRSPHGGALGQRRSDASGSDRRKHSPEREQVHRGGGNDPRPRAVSSGASGREPLGA